MGLNPQSQLQIQCYSKDLFDKQSKPSALKNYEIINGTLNSILYVCVLVSGTKNHNSMRITIEMFTHKHGWVICTSKYFEKTY